MNWNAPVLNNHFVTRPYLTASCKASGSKCTKLAMFNMSFCPHELDPDVAWTFICSTIYAYTLYTFCHRKTCFFECFQNRLVSCKLCRIFLVNKCRLNNTCTHFWSCLGSKEHIRHSLQFRRIII